MSSKEIKIDLTNTDFIQKINSACNYLDLFRVTNEQNPIVNAEAYNDVLLVLNAFIYLAGDSTLGDLDVSTEFNSWLQENKERLSGLIQQSQTYEIDGTVNP